MSKPRPKPLPKPLPAKTEIPRNKQEISFSFKYFDFDNHVDKFGFAHMPDNDYPNKLFCRLKNICGFQFGQFIGDRSESLRAHPIRWCDTSCPNGFSHLNEQLQPDQAYYFSISEGSRKHEGGDGRVIGFFDTSTFFIVWLDPRHRLYP